MGKKVTKRLRSIKLVILCLSVTSSFANPVCSRIGAITDCGNGILEELHVAGKATLDGTTVLGKTEIAGMLLAERVALVMQVTVPVGVIVGLIIVLTTETVPT